LIVYLKIYTKKPQVCHRWRLHAKGRQQGAEVTPKRQRSLEYKNVIVHEGSYLFAHIRGTEMQKKVGKIILQCTK